MTSKTGWRNSFEIRKYAINGFFLNFVAHLIKCRGSRIKKKERGVIACSAGNHAQGVALSAHLLGIKSKIVMPISAPQAKVEATKGYGSEVIFTW